MAQANASQPMNHMNMTAAMKQMRSGMGGGRMPRPMADGKGN